MPKKYTPVWAQNGDPRESEGMSADQQRHVDTHRNRNSSAAKQQRKQRATVANGKAVYQKDLSTQELNQRRADAKERAANHQALGGSYQLEDGSIMDTHGNITNPNQPPESQPKPPAPGEQDPGNSNSFVNPGYEPPAWPPKIELDKDQGEYPAIMPGENTPFEPHVEPDWNVRQPLPDKENAPGDPSDGGPPVYHNEWVDWYEKNPNATAEEQVDYEGQLREKYGMPMTNKYGDRWDTIYVGGDPNWSRDQFSQGQIWTGNSFDQK